MLRKCFFNFWLVFLVLFALKAAFAQESRFVIGIDERNLSSSHADYLELWPYLPVPDSGIDHWIRTRFDLRPGDYFRYPRGAGNASLTESEKNEVMTALHRTIDSSLYNSLVLENLNGCEYLMDHGKVHRREYHVRYSCGDTIYVISGWLGKFLSFYRVVPGDQELSIEQLQDEINSISPLFGKVNETKFTVRKDELNYFIQYIDREIMLRVRNYKIFEWQYPDPNEIPAGGRYFDYMGKKYYNLIEITRFIDKEVIP